jgi:hypothetical protein
LESRSIGLGQRLGRHLASSRPSTCPLAPRASIETDDQSAPSDTMCLAYNAVLAAALGKTEPSCRFVKHGYYGGKCECS